MKNLINPNNYGSTLSYDDREIFFLDNLTDRTNRNAVTAPYSKDTFRINADVYQIFAILKTVWPDLRVFSESNSRIVYYLESSEDTYLVIAFTVPMYANKEGILFEKNLSKASMTISAPFEDVNDIFEKIRTLLGPLIVFEEEKLETSWVQLQPDGSLCYRVMPIKETGDRILAESYPWMEDPNKYVDDFLASKSPVLILSGPPGTGKSTFIRHILQRAPRSFEIFSVYDEDVMKLDNLYASFISNSNEAIMVLEDADRLLERRIEDQNTTMSKILNVSDGIIDLTMKKIIFSSNIENVGDVDQALIRPGRCFDILEFRNLDRDEAQILANRLGKTLPESSKEYPLSEIFNSKSGPKAHRLGF